MSHKISHSPRVKAHKLKVASSNRSHHGGQPASIRKNKARRSLHLDNADDDDGNSNAEVSVPTYDSLESYSKKIGSPRMEPLSPDIKSAHGSPMYYSANDVELESISHKLNQAMQENSKLRSKLRVEMEEKYVLEQKVVSLTEKLVEAKRGLQDTSFALQKVQLVTSQLMSKKDEREMQLQEAQLQNNSLQRTVTELNRQLAEVMDQHAKEIELHINRREREATATPAASAVDKGAAEVDSQLTAYREQVAQLKRENFKLAEEKADAQYMIEAKNNRITVLEDRLRVAEAKMLLEWGSSTPNRDSLSATGMPPGMQRPMSSSDYTGVGRPSNSLESKIIMLETDKSALEQRLAVLERQFSHPVIAAAAQLAPSIMSQVVEAQYHSQSLTSPPQRRVSASSHAAQTQPPPSQYSQQQQQQQQQQLQQQQQQQQQPSAGTATAPPRSSQPLYLPSPQLAATAARQSQPTSGEADRGQSLAPLASPIMARSPSTRSTSKILKRNSLPPVIETDTSTATTHSSGEDFARARSAAQAAVMASTSTEPVATEDRPSSSPMHTPSMTQFRREQSMFFHEATEQPIEEDADDAGADDAKRKLEQEKKAAKKAIMVWYRGFVAENNREPTKVERDMYVGEIYKQYRRSSKTMKELESKK